jgi:hypothetical protein
MATLTLHSNRPGTLSATTPVTRSPQASRLLLLALAVMFAAFATACVHAWTPASMSIAGVGDRPAQPAAQSRAAVQQNTVIVQQANPWVSPYRNVWVTPVHPGWGYPYPVYRGAVYHGPAWRGGWGPTYGPGYAPGGCFNCPVHVGRTIHHRSSTVYRR